MLSRSVRLGLMAHTTALDTGVIGESWRHRSATFARDGFVLSGGPVVPEEIVARARSSFERIVGRYANLQQNWRIGEPESFLFNTVYVGAAGRTRGNIP